MMIRRTLTIAMLVSSSATPSAAIAESDDRRLAAMTSAQFQARSTLDDDALDTTATITTAEGFRERKPLFGPTPQDVFLRAFIDKATGRTRYQVYVTLRYRGYGWADWRLANYATPSGPKSVVTQKIIRLRGTCQRTFPCLRSETIGFFVNREVLQSSATLVTGSIVPWRFKILARVGEERALFLSAAEISGLLMAVDAYRADHHLPTV
jgi:Ni/Co efflux regulator RcnB